MLHVEEISESIINKENFPGIINYVEISNGQDKCVLTDKYAMHYAEKIKNFEVYEDDVWVITFPKCGTTWTQEIVWLLNHNMDYEAASKSTIDLRFPFIEIEGLVEERRESLKACRELKRPRHIKSHLPKFLLPDQLWTVNPKIIYVARNPKDAAVSYYHHYHHILGYNGSKENFFNIFLQDKLFDSPMNQQVLEFWKLRNESNILFLFYEDMKRDLKQEILKIMNLLGKNYSDEQIDKLCQHVSFESMRNNPSANKTERVQFVKTHNNFASKNEKFSFLRKGKVGSHITEMSEDMKEKFDLYMNFPGFEDVDFSYKI